MPRVHLLAAALSAAIAGPTLAQDLDAIDAKLRFRLDGDGQVLMAPDPETGDADQFVPLAGGVVGASLIHTGLFGWLNFVAGGPTDFASLTDARHFFARLGREDAEILQAAAGTDRGPGGRARLLRQLLAIRALERAGTKAAIPTVDLVAADETADRFVRRAAQEAAAVLRGAERPPLGVAHPPMTGILASVPAEADLVLRVDGWRMPSATDLGSHARAVARSVSRTMMNSAVGLTERDYLTGLRTAELASVLPYDIARRYGNHRIERVVLAMRIPDGGAVAEPLCWAVADGVFDVDSVRAGLEVDGLASVSNAAGELEFDVVAGYRMAVGPARVRIWNAQLPSGSRDELPASLRAIADPAATIGLWVAPDIELPESVARLRPDWLTLQVPPSGRGDLKLEGAWPDPTGAAAFRALLMSGRGFVERAAAEVPALDPVLDALDELTVDARRARVTASVPIPAVDLGELLVALIESGLVR